jgi:hypothetical protein
MQYTGPSPGWPPHYGLVKETSAVFEAKFMLPWSFSEEGAAEKHMAQLQHNMLVAGTRKSVLSIINGGGKWVELSHRGRPDLPDHPDCRGKGLLAGGQDGRAANSVRKTLGGQQIAIAQTTDIDRTSGTVNLTTSRKLLTSASEGFPEPSSG